MHHAVARNRRTTRPPDAPATASLYTCAQPQCGDACGACGVTAQDMALSTGPHRLTRAQVSTCDRIHTRLASYRQHDIKTLQLVMRYSYGRFD